MNPIIAAVHTHEDFHNALQSPVDLVFLMSANILTLKEYADAAHQGGKKLFVHADMMQGIGRDSHGVEYIAKMGADGIISTRSNILKMAREQGLATVQRFFIIDFHSVETAIQAVKTQKPDMIELMPGVVPKVIAHFSQSVKVPIITGGLIETKQEIIQALQAGADAVSTSNMRLWQD